MEISQDWKEWLESLNANQVEYVIIGGLAVGHHGWVRYTKDMDMLIHAEHENIKRLIRALEDFDFGSIGLRVEDFENPDDVVQLGVEPNRIDLLTAVEGADWNEIKSDRSPGNLGGVPTYFIGLKTLLKVKRATGRPEDLGDVSRLERSHGLDS